jgi:hypothetical protein
MKKLSCLLSVVLILFAFQMPISSCTKTETKTDTVIVKVTPISSLLLGKQWIVDSLYQNYTGSNPGTRVYARGGTNNTQNLDDAIVVMWPDGGQLFFYNGIYYNYTYTFRNSDSTELLIHNPNPDYARIVNLTNDHLTIYDSTNSALSYYKYKP